MTENQNNPLGLFTYALKSSETRSKYIRKIQNFFDFLGLEGTIQEQAEILLSDIKKNQEGWITSKMMDYIQFHKARAEKGEIAFSTVRNYYKPVKLFLEMNDIQVVWKKIIRGLPRGRKFADDRAPTLAEIQKLVEYPDRRIRAIVFTMCSGGIRLGAWDYLRWSDITPIERDGKVIAAKMTVYSGEPDHYITFISPEAYSELKKWMDIRKEAGENVSGNSWLMRDLWDMEKFSRGLVTVPKKLQSAGIKRLMERALKGQGLRKNLPEGKRRYEFQADHGFRKFFKTQAEQVMKPINVEILMGHSTGISDSYYRPNEGNLLEDYIKAIPEFTISKENRMNNDIEKLKTSSSDNEKTK
ncbi:MAG TPA: hypothetical protein VEJ68_01615, partial [Candidatus Bathyarchaeia archaeon]|nr:hypothetical protein [Candidatus Bathyarchaeia archaeon]